MKIHLLSNMTNNWHFSFSGKGTMIVVPTGPGFIGQSGEWWDGRNVWANYGLKWPLMRISALENVSPHGKKMSMSMGCVVWKMKQLSICGSCFYCQCVGFWWMLYCDCVVLWLECKGTTCKSPIAVTHDIESCLVCTWFVVPINTAVYSNIWPRTEELQRNLAETEYLCKLLQIAEAVEFQIYFNGVLNTVMYA